MMNAAVAGLRTSSKIYDTGAGERVEKYVVKKKKKNSIARITIRRHLSVPVTDDAAAVPFFSP